jgi:hypothetical protein
LLGRLRCFSCKNLLFHVVGCAVSMRLCA